MKELLKKISQARKIIASKDIKKDGKNTYSNYDYFTPSLVAGLVDPACDEVGILPVFSLLIDDSGYYGSLTVYDIYTDQSITTIMRTEKPDIKATNSTQQMGGCETYTKRYMLMSMFSINDNSIDFDSQDNRKKTNKMNKKDDKPWFNEPNLKKFTQHVVQYDPDVDYIAQIRVKYKLSKDMENKVKQYLNSIT